MLHKSVDQKTKIDRKKAESFLFPIAAFLKDGGLSRMEATEVLLAAYERAGKTFKKQKIKHIGHRIPYQNVIASWIRDKRFLDASGKPRILAMGGRDGFAALVRQGRGQYKIDPKTMLSVLLHYGNVRKIGKDRYSLVESFFNSFGFKDLAFEPHASFLADASETLGRMLVGKKKTQARKPFWLRVENVELSAVAARKFNSYIRSRSLTFLEEVDDWLEAHAQKDKKSRSSPRKRRVGLGLFSIDSNRTEPV